MDSINFHWPPSRSIGQPSRSSIGPAAHLASSPSIRSFASVTGTGASQTVLQRSQNDRMWEMAIGSKSQI
jgi:hypothetical protein